MRAQRHLSPTRKLLFLAFVGVACFALLEAGFRGYLHWDAWRYETALHDRDGRQTAGNRQLPTFLDMIRPSASARVIYELLPNLSVLFIERVTTDARGFRRTSTDAFVPGGRRTFRILGLGDSLMFGWGVADADTYLAVLRAQLEREFPEIAWDVVNTAVPGYNTAMEVAVLKEKALPLDPDLVLIHFVGNDLDLPNFIRPARSYTSLSRSFLLDALLHRSVSSPDSRPSVGLIPAPSRNGRFLSRPEQVPQRYRDMVGIEGYRRAMRELSALSKAHGFEVVIICHPEVDPLVAAMSQDLGMPIASSAELVARYVRRHALRGRHDPALTIDPPRDIHPSAVGHRLIAEAILETLHQERLLPLQP